MPVTVDGRVAIISPIVELQKGLEVYFMKVYDRLSGVGRYLMLHKSVVQLHTILEGHNITVENAKLFSFQSSPSHDANLSHDIKYPGALWFMVDSGATIRVYIECDENHLYSQSPLSLHSEPVDASFFNAKIIHLSKMGWIIVQTESGVRRKVLFTLSQSAFLKEVIPKLAHCLQHQQFISLVRLLPAYLYGKCAAWCFTVRSSIQFASETNQAVISKSSALRLKLPKVLRGKCFVFAAWFSQLYELFSSAECSGDYIVSVAESLLRVSADRSSSSGDHALAAFRVYRNVSEEFSSSYEDERVCCRAEQDSDYLSSLLPQVLSFNYLQDQLQKTMDLWRWSLPTRGYGMSRQNQEVLGAVYLSSTQLLPRWLPCDHESIQPKPVLSSQHTSSYEHSRVNSHWPEQPLWSPPTTSAEVTDSKQSSDSHHLSAPAAISFGRFVSTTASVLATDFYNNNLMGIVCIWRVDMHSAPTEDMSPRSTSERARSASEVYITTNTRFVVHYTGAQCIEPATMTTKTSVAVVSFHQLERCVSTTVFRKLSVASKGRVTEPLQITIGFEQFTLISQSLGSAAASSSSSPISSNHYLVADETVHLFVSCDLTASSVPVSLPVKPSSSAPKHDVTTIRSVLGDFHQALQTSCGSGTRSSDVSRVYRKVQGIVLRCTYLPSSVSNYRKRTYADTLKSASSIGRTTTSTARKIQYSLWLRDPVSADTLRIYLTLLHNESQSSEGCDCTPNPPQLSAALLPGALICCSALQVTTSANSQSNKSLSSDRHLYSTPSLKIYGKAVVSSIDSLYESATDSSSSDATMPSSWSLIALETKRDVLTRLGSVFWNSEDSNSRTIDPCAPIRSLLSSEEWFAAPRVHLSQLHPQQPRASWGSAGILSGVSYVVTADILLLRRVQVSLRCATCFTTLRRIPVPSNQWNANLRATLPQLSSAHRMTCPRCSTSSSAASQEICWEFVLCVDDGSAGEVLVRFEGCDLLRALLLQEGVTSNDGNNDDGNINSNSDTINYSTPTGRQDKSGDKNSGGGGALPEPENNSSESSPRRLRDLRRRAWQAMHSAICSEVQRVGCFSFLHSSSSVSNDPSQQHQGRNGQEDDNNDSDFEDLQMMLDMDDNDDLFDGSMVSAVQQQHGVPSRQNNVIAQRLLRLIHRLDQFNASNTTSNSSGEHNATQRLNKLWRSFLHNTLPSVYSTPWQIALSLHPLPTSDTQVDTNVINHSSHSSGPNASVAAPTMRLKIQQDNSHSTSQAHYAAFSFLPTLLSRPAPNDHNSGRVCGRRLQCQGHALKALFTPSYHHQQQRDVADEAYRLLQELQTKHL